MKSLAWLCLPLASACTPPGPPAQVVEPLPPAPSGSPSARPDMANDDGKLAEPPPPSAPTEAFQPVRGTLDGAPWELKGAGTLGPVQADGNVQVVLANYHVDCGLHTPGPGDRTITVSIPWKAKVQLDLGALKGKETSAMGFDEKKKKLVPIRGYKPKGTLDVLSAPTGLRSSGRIKIDLTSGKDAIQAEIPVRLCGG